MVTPKTVKGYELFERIGSGGYGVVHRAIQTTVGREVAIKVILPHFANHPDFIRRFEAEAQIIARLEHPHIVPLYDYWRGAEGAFLVMRWLRGGNLRAAVANGPFDLAAAALLMDQITSALAMAHRNDIIHRDLKPSNILLDEDGNAYLSDFGIAVSNFRAKRTPGQEDAFLGGPDYLSPEQARGERVSPQTDVYSLGVVLYEVLTGHPPFPHLSMVERLYKHLNEPLPLLDSLTPEIAAGMNAIIQKATAKNPAQRYADVLEMSADFRREADLSQRSAEAVVEQMTLREQEILQMITEGCSNKEIAERLYVTLPTVKWHVRQVYQKLRVRSRVQAIMRARELNLIIPDTPPESATGEVSYVIPLAPDNPYKGLRPFQAADARDFFGREKLVQRLVERLGEPGVAAHFLAVVGPSGSGKSSVVLAGLVPALWRGALPGSERWFVVEMIPGAHPPDELEIGLARVAADQAGNLREHLERDARGLVRAANLILPDDGSELVLIVDQFEEVFTLLEDEAQRIHFLDLLEHAATDARSRVRVILTLRADFYDRPLHYPRFGELVRAHMETVMPLSADELEAAITKPAARVGVSFEPGLVSSIIGDVHYQPGALPLLQYALTEMFEQRTDGVITCEAYGALGGATGALARRAEELYHEQDADGQAIVRQMFLRLVTLGDAGDDTRRRVPRAELLALADDDERVDEVIDTFAAYRLLTLDRDPASRQPTVEIAHEAMLHEWERLRMGLNESRHDIHQQRLLAAAAAEWASASRDPSFLLQGSRLEQFEGWAADTSLALTQTERAFLEISGAAQRTLEQTERERQARELALARAAAESAQHAAEAARLAEVSQRQATSRLRYLVVGLAVFLVAAVLLSIFAFGKEREANASRLATEREARVNHSLVLAAGARQEAGVGRGDLALLLAMEAVRVDDPPVDVRNTLADVAFAPATRMVLAAHQGETRAVAFSPDGRTLLSAGCSPGALEDGACRRGELVVSDVDTGDVLNRWEGHADWINAVAVDFAPAREGLAMAVSASADGTLIAWDLLTGQELYRMAGHSEAVTDVVFVPSGQVILSASDDDTAILWDAANGQILSRLEGHAADVNAVAVSPDGTRAATASDDRTILAWDIDPASPTLGQVVQRFEGHGSGVFGVAFVSQGAALLSNSPDLTFRLWDAETGVELRQRMIGAYGGGGVVGPDGRTALVPIGAQLYLWDTEVWQQDRLLVGHAERIWDVAFSADGRLAATASGDGTIRLWNIDAQEETDRHQLGAPAFALEMSPDGSRLVAGEGSAEGNLWLFDTRSLAEPRVLPGPGLAIAPGAIAVAPDGRVALGGALAVDTQVKIMRLMLWDLESGDVIRELGEREFPYRSVAISPDGRLALVGTQDFSEYDLGGELFLLDLETWEIVRQFDTTEDITSIVFSRDGTQAISGSCYFEDAARWEIESGLAIRSYPQQPACVLSLIYGPDETTIITASNDGSITEWDSQTGEKIRNFARHDGPVWGLDLSWDGRLLASGSSDGSVILWDYATGQAARRFEGHTGWIFDVAFSPDGTALYSASGDGTVREWHVSEWQLAELQAWVGKNRYLRDFTCEERAQYRIEPLCDEG